MDYDIKPSSQIYVAEREKLYVCLLSVALHNDGVG
jgi:hypothetical protein